LLRNRSLKEKKVILKYKKNLLSLKLSFLKEKMNIIINKKAELLSIKMDDFVDVLLKIFKDTIKEF